MRSDTAIQILRKVLSFEEGSVIEQLTGDTPFGIATNFKGYRDKERPGDVRIYYVSGGKRGFGFIPSESVTKNRQLISDWKVLAPKAGSDGGQKIPDYVLGKPWVVGPKSVCTQTFLAFWLPTEDEARNFETYYSTKFFRFLVSLRKITQDALRSTYQWVPTQDFSKAWTTQSFTQNMSSLKRKSISLRA